MPFGEIVLVLLVYFFFLFFLSAKDLKICFFGFGDIDFVICDFFFPVKKNDFVVIFVSGKKREKRLCVCVFWRDFVCCHVVFLRNRFCFVCMCVCMCDF